MKNTYIHIAIVILLLIAGTTAFYIYTNKKTSQITQNIKKVDTFEVTGGSSGLFGANLFGGAVNELGGGGSLTEQETISDDSNTYEQWRNEIHQIYDLPTAGVGFAQLATKPTDNTDKEDGESASTTLETKIVFTDMVNGYSYTKSSPLSQNTPLPQSAKRKTFSAQFSNTYIMRSSLDYNFSLVYDVEKIGEPNTNITIKDAVQCRLFENDTIICQEKSKGGDFTFYKLKIDEEGVSKEFLYKSPFRQWVILGYTKQGLFLAQKPSAMKYGAVLKIANNEVEVLAQQIGLDAKLSKDGKYLLYSFYDQGSLKMALKNMLGNGVEELPIKSLAQKCAFVLNNQLLCAVPQNNNDIIIDRWVKGEIDSLDEFYVYDIETAQKTKLKFDSTHADNIDVWRLVSSPDQSMVAFVNKFNLKPWVVALKKEGGAQKEVEDKQTETATSTTNETSASTTEEQNIELELRRR